MEFIGDNATENAQTTRDNLGLGDSAVADIGTTAGTVCAGDDARLGGEVRSDFVSPYTYTGLTAAGTAESTASWTIRRSEYTSAGAHVATLTANAVEWDDRLTASYS